MTPYHGLAALTLILFIASSAFGQPRADAQGDPLPPGVILRLGTLRLRHEAPVKHIRIAPKGDLLVTSDGRNIRVWELATGRRVRQFQSPIDENDPRYSRDGTEVNSIALSADGELLGAAFTSHTQLWELATGNEVSIPPSRDQPSLHAIAFTPDTKTFAVSDYGGVTIREIKTGLDRQRIPTAKPMYSLAFSPDGKLLAGGGMDGVVRVWDWARGKEAKSFAASHYVISYVVFDAEGKTLAAAGTYDTCAWDVATGKELFHLKGYRGSVYSIALSTSGRLAVVGGSEAPLQLIDVTTGKEIRQIGGRQEQAGAVALSPDGKTLATGAWGDCLVRLRDLATGQDLHPFPGHVREVRAVAFSPDGLSLVSGGIDGIRLWDTRTGRQTYHVRTDYVSHLAVSPDGGTFVTGQSMRVVRLWQTATGKELRQFEGAPNLNSVAFSPDGSILATGGINDRAVWLWDAASGREIRRLLPDQFDMFANENTSVTFAQDGRTLAAKTSGKIRLWDVASGKQLWEIDGRPPGVSHAVECLIASPDGKTLASGTGNGLVVLWDASTGKLIRQFPQDKGKARREPKIWALAFSPDGKTLAAADGKTIRLLETETLRLRRTLDASALSLAFSPDGKRLASGNWDTIVLIWELTAR